MMGPMNREDAEDSSPHFDQPRRGRVATEVPIPGAVGAGAAFCAGTVLVALRWLAGVQLGGPGLVLMCAAVAWIVGARLAARSHENSHWDKMMTGAMEPRTITVGVEGVFGMWALSIDGQAPIAAALCGDDDAKIIVDAANLCMASPRRLRKMPGLSRSADLWRPIQTGTVRTAGEALSLVAEALNQHKANGSGPADN